ncbi:protein of unknown function DUF150 [Beutenbergia cavernae DSM 12333]|uniref:Ribosome maturation factor RimP n=1 Tax=Beutenbergia cavernae (strain ATCC BAA-8 / DSM 12333 / CCUG 43141 / JCM 11478 / NBRC 16432 / NCIMB 13614 / HKI 0122) TaxID=471853 RepID=RIMP_BEUC1|nr:ribosome maturation factor RimP [Beutenbergia cavernae]C5BWS6.1 RecName: Full=Ribosome maturation factor RimP [Beutenbergia cavernae DSM 12333]ACQ80742.1 protein of unknown function DUF150 [Beutenbergia cavernae DSM 12333]
MTPSPDTALLGRLRDLLEPVAAGCGLHLEDVAVSPAGRRRRVRVTLDLADGPGALGSNDLADASRAVSAALDDADVVTGPYVLEVSTPGTDRPLTQPRHFRRAQGRLVTLTLAAGTHVSGRLLSADDDGIHVRTDAGATTTFAYADVATGRVEVELRHLEEG